MTRLPSAYQASKEPAPLAARANEELITRMYETWRENASAVDEYWRAFFSGFSLGCEQDRGEAGDVAHMGSDSTGHTLSDRALNFRARLARMVQDYRARGHTGAWLDPLRATAPEIPEYLQEEAFGFLPEEMNLPVATGQWRDGARMTLREMLADLREVYCGYIGFEFMHIHKHEVQDWLRQKIENRRVDVQPDAQRDKLLLHWLLEGEQFERFLHRKYVGQKRFSLEGGESLLCALQTILEACPAEGVSDLVMGMAHRGRLTVLANFVDKPLHLLFHEFSENYLPDAVAGDGDVKYHLGYAHEVETVSGGKVEIHLAANPSHLEAVNPVVEGKARGRQRQIGDIPGRKKVLPVLIHGDAAFAGQGMVPEVLNLSQLSGYRTGGTIHIIVNNQIGFTTTPRDARSSDYCTDVAKMIEAPVVHVNGDMPGEVAFAAALAFEFRQKFARDVVLDIVCYRRHGHNEGDEPSFTLPDMTRLIQQHTPVAQLFRNELLKAGVLNQEEADRMETVVHDKLERSLAKLESGEFSESEVEKYASDSARPQPAYSHDTGPTGVVKERILKLGHSLLATPKDFHVNEVIRKRFLGSRQQALESGDGIDWAHAEALAFASLLTEKRHIRLSGQDVRRGTFSQRHCVLYDTENRERYIPLMNVAEGQAPFSVYNSLLSEAAVLGFEYGYSLVLPDSLVIWEAQFGDFANGAQVIIDQFIAASETKWGSRSGVTLLLPHGYEGQGPEHSSARLERFLQLCVNGNMQVAHLTTPAQYFHILRRQVSRHFVKPLVLMTPKSLLRNPLCVSSLADFEEGTSFHTLLDDPRFSKAPEQAKRVILCTGKVYYDLLAKRDHLQASDTAIVRIEQLHPLNDELLTRILARYERAGDLVWSQEEPANMGAWAYMEPLIEAAAGRRARYAGRVASASTAAGSKALHNRQLEIFLTDAFRSASPQTKIS